MNRFYLIVCMLLCLIQNVKAQEESNYTWDIGLNVTSVLSTFLGNDNTLEASDFPLFLRIGSEKLKFRLGIGGESSSKTIFDPVTITSRVSKSYGAAMRIGFEKYQNITDRFSFYWGIDGTVIFSKNEVRNVFQNLPSVSENALGFGGGGVLGLRFNCSRRIYLSTEATIYGLARREKRSTLNVSPFTNTFFDFAITPPLFLQFNVILD